MFTCLLIFRMICNVCEYRLNDPAPDLGKLAESLPDSTTEGRETAICAVCLDIFRPAFLRDIVDKASDLLSTCNFDVREFALAFGMPPSIDLREALVRKKTGRPESDVLGAKVALKHLLSTALVAKHPEMTFSAKASLQLIVTISNDALIAAEGKILQDEKGGGGGYRANKNRWREKRKKFTRKANMADLMELVGKLSSIDDLPAPTDGCGLKVSFFRSPVWFAGRYNKFSRSMNQTPWMVDGVALSTSSVDQIISGPLLRATGANGHAFTASGREDADVRMLGSGRPFMVSLENPTRAKFDECEVSELQHAINARSSGDVKVSRLTLLRGEGPTKKLKEAEETKRKHYVAVCCSQSPLSAEQLQSLDRYAKEELVINQRTPLRVMHRRSVISRERIIHKMTYLQMSEFRLQLFLVTQAGTYVKEFVHGDLGRTQPALCDLIGSPGLDILELDVNHVDMEWP